VGYFISGHLLEHEPGMPTTASVNLRTVVGEGAFPKRISQFASVVRANVLLARVEVIEGAPCLCKFAAV
jgi:hypothetical protein